MDWFIFALIAITLYGIQNFIYKIVNEKKCDLFLVTLFFYITVASLAFVVFIFSGFNILNLSITLVLGLAFAVAFYLKTLGQLKALEYLPTNKVFPITSSFAILTVISALFIFKETLSLIQVCGIMVIMISLIFIHNDAKKKTDYHEKKIGFLIAFLAIIPAAGVEIINKFAAINSNLSAFLFVAYFFAMGISLIGYKLQKKKSKNILHSVKIGVLIGFVNFLGFYSGLTALKYGPLSLITPIFASCMVITIILGKIVYKEELSFKQGVLILLIILGVILLRI